MRHRVANFDWDDDWVFSDPRFQLADGPDQVLLDFLALMAHPLVQPDTEQAARLVAALASPRALVMRLLAASACPSTQWA